MTIPSTLTIAAITAETLTTAAPQMSGTSTATIQTATTGTVEIPKTAETFQIAGTRETQTAITEIVEIAPTTAKIILETPTFGRNKMSTATTTGTEAGTL